MEDLGLKPKKVVKKLRYDNVICMKTKDSSLLQMKNAREEEQQAVMKQIIEDGVCPFCEENFETYHTKPVLFKTEYWIVTENAWPYKMTRKHFLLVYRPKHIEQSKEVVGPGWQDFTEVVSRLENEFSLSYGTFLMRFGDMEKTGATVKHLHMQLIQSDPDNPDYDPKTGIWTRIG
ncbi:MAG: hypothetical protein O3B47_05775 [bacterium]|nr:hypothetical protein [bacterium]